MFHTPYEAAPFSQFTAFDYLPAIQTAINDSLAEIQKISKTTNLPLLKILYFL